MTPLSEATRLVAFAAAHPCTEADEAVGRHDDPLLSAVALASQILLGESTGVIGMYEDAALNRGHLTHAQCSTVKRQTRCIIERTQLIAQHQGRVLSVAALHDLCFEEAKQRVDVYRATRNPLALAEWLGVSELASLRSRGTSP